MSMKTKDRCRRSTTPNPSLSKEGNCALPSSREEGLGVVGGLDMFLAEQSENVYENKG
jgi:hypothetical protein